MPSAEQSLSFYLAWMCQTVVKVSVNHILERAGAYRYVDLVDYGCHTFFEMIELYTLYCVAIQ
jgi:hypothetical protein